ncbi:hypothetical protein CKO11_07090 [Rhodobacter sp. TJ_12]|uniref:hypothetical protein n=1 Tax=Rhodobacter sp. TJ_12 TaxID=2029399 RepID=UPI001CBE9F48|nr:hypothetical protein [Rhodobacter sp. TJ_12]MBZ4022220.1 hypothetical protein [Rhodobacter sp. TJ_12]
MTESFALPMPGVFLTEADHALMRHHLRGVRMVELRQIGGPPEAGAEVLAHLEAEGFAVKFRVLERMSPPPLCRIVFRYPGPKQAEMTIAPEVEV